MPRAPDLLPDWFVGGRGKRTLLAALVDPSHDLWSSGPPWSRRALAGAAGLHEKHAVDRHIAVLESAGVLTRDPDGWALVATSPLVPALRAYLAALDALPATRLPPSRGA